jgi:hypothetical protein
MGTSRSNTNLYKKMANNMYKKIRAKLILK